MARFSRMDVLGAMYDTGLVALFYHADVEVARQVVRACHQGGLRLLEFTHRGDAAPRVFAELQALCAAELPQMITGVGSIVDPATASSYINMGANFVVGPILNPDIARLCNRRKIPYTPGCATGTEISQAEELGCEIVKVFPARELGGPAFLKALRGPMPWTSLMPTGGVEIDQAALESWFGAGACCVGVGSSLIRDELIRRGDYDALTREVEKTLEVIRSVRQKSAKAR